MQSMQNFHVPLDSLELLQISGEDSGKFLQGQLTCDLDGFASGSCQLGAACNNKGRVYANFRLLKLGDDFFLSMQPGVLEIAMQTLQKYIPFYKAQMSDASHRFKRFGLAGNQAAELLKNIVPALPEKNCSTNVDGNIFINISDNLPRYELWLDDSNSADIQARIKTLPRQEKSAWDILDLEAGILLIQDSESTLYTPEELNLDLAGFISFNKGCYTGQEIVARMHFRGKANKRLFLASFETDAAAENLTLYDNSGKALGTLFNLQCLNDTRHIGLVILKTNTALTESFRLGEEETSSSVMLSPFSHIE
ncbi:hypothetical protein N8600_06050 [Gammaproteobacteria bacterium]|nr:hypothetical protein [Gammaproteobacteria bacterium]